MPFWLSTISRLVIAFWVMQLSVQPAVAQGSAPRRPAGGLFGATRTDISEVNKLNFTFGLAEGIDSALPPELGGGPAATVTDTGGLSTLFAATSDYSRIRRRIRVAASAATAFKYYQQLDRLDPISHAGALGIGTPLPGQGSFEVTQSAAYSPAYLYQLFPVIDPPSLGESIPSNPEYKIDQQDSYTYTTRAGVKYGSARTTQLETFGEYRMTEYDSGSSAPPSLETRAIGTRVSYAMSRSASFTFGYQYRAGEFGYSEPTEEHAPNIGVTYSPALSGTRRLSIRFDASPSWVRVPASELSPVDDPVAAQVSSYLYRMQGDASVSYPFKPNWRASVTYHRGVEYLAGLTQPLLSDGSRVEVAGLLKRRLDLAASAGYVTAISAPAGSRQNLDTYTGTVKMRYALKRSMALYTEYLYYYYDQEGESLLVEDLPAVFSQHGFRVGMTFFIEALGR